ncbi:hypothetical protein AB0M92_37140 [Streptomyces sp. NPDC051582]
MIEIPEISAMSAADSPLSRSRPAWAAASSVEIRAGLPAFSS